MTRRRRSWRLLLRQPGHRRQRGRPRRRRDRRADRAIGLRRSASTTSTCPTRCSRPAAHTGSAPTNWAATSSPACWSRSQASLRVAVVSVAFAVVVGVTIGVVAGYRGGWLDTVVHARRRRDVRVPGAAARAGGRGDPRARCDDDDPGDRHRLHADLRARRARQHAECACRAVRSGVAHHGHRPPVHPAVGTSCRTSPDR